MTYRQSKLPIALRIIAAGCVMLWLAGVSACNLDALFCCDAHEGESVAHEDHEHQHVEVDADTDHAHGPGDHHSEEVDSHSHDTHEHDGKAGACCSTLKAVVQTGKPVIFSKPAFHPAFVLNPPFEAYATSPARVDMLSSRHADRPDWVITPQVCLGAAHRSLAPPSLA